MALNFTKNFLLLYLKTVIKIKLRPEMYFKNYIKKGGKDMLPLMAHETLKIAIPCPLYKGQRISVSLCNKQKVHGGNACELKKCPLVEPRIKLILESLAGQIIYCKSIEYLIPVEACIVQQIENADKCLGCDRLRRICEQV